MEEIKEILEQEAAAIRAIPVNSSYTGVIEMISDRVHRLKGKIITSGMGKAGQVADHIATTFCSTGTPALFLHPSEAQHGDLGVIRENDLLLVLTNSGAEIGDGKRVVDEVFADAATREGDPFSLQVVQRGHVAAP